MMLKIIKIQFFLLTLFLFTAISADTINYSADTLGEPSWNRTDSCFGPPSANVSYHIQGFSINTNDSCTLQVNALSFQDMFLHLYSDPFDPYNQLDNCVNSNDDFNGLNSQITNETLVSGQTYVMVTSGFSNDDIGSFNASIDCPNAIVSLEEATVSPIPPNLALFTANTSQEPTWNRTDGCEFLSSIGTNVSYHLQEFSINSNDVCSIEANATSGQDMYLNLYRSSFNPDDQATNCIIDDDDGGLGTNSQIFNQALISDQTYIMVTSGYSDNDNGEFNGVINCRNATVSLSAAIIPSTSIPTLSIWSLILLTVILLCFGRFARLKN